jgi:predicted AlkP superfamily pyrophosphatase or phosphodiesterase
MVVRYGGRHVLWFLAHFRNAEAEGRSFSAPGAQAWALVLGGTGYHWRTLVDRKPRATGPLNSGKLETADFHSLNQESTTMKRFLPAVVTGLLVIASGMPRPALAGQPHADAPRLVVGIVVDQMRPDFLYRYWDKYGEGGFKRLVNEGFTFRNAYFPYMETATGTGHAVHWTGATPAVHGLLGNNWYVRELGRSINVIEDVGSGHRGVGSSSTYNGEKSPANMLTTTVGDELFLHTNHRSRTIGISRKDRGAILPAGHTGQAYWYESATGNLVTSTYYREDLPSWLQEFNARGLAQQYLTRVWEPLLPIEEYVESMADDNPYEARPDGSDFHTFPIDLRHLIEERGFGSGILNRTPFADELILEASIAAIEGERLGRGPVPDILSIGFSAADAIGHRWGPASKQVQDYYLRLDRYLAHLLDYLDREFGKDNVLVFLTSDHGVAHIPHYLRDLGIPTGNSDNETEVMNEMLGKLRAYLVERYGHDLLLAYSNKNLYFDHDFINGNGLDHAAVQQDVKRFLLTLAPVGGAVTANSLNSTEFTNGMRGLAQQSFHQKRSGDVVVWLTPHTLYETGTGGTSHGSPWVYDTHAPLLFFGHRVPAGQSVERVYVSDIASTLAIFLNSPFPSGNIGNPLNDLMVGRR